ncbi:hypothetical protein HNP46_000344 [Pseudomonas nitritireducens]|uniref:Uncharacterized protein n=1 Tax=Pseudomonas nitroreducens TaxID=46680 RepID=A0A7W7NYB9_PSENT|nr:hypothetical protein [Pseudomonas nitritireducens]MBB4861533.1 hypothetical protein [Pseudomonas nitritireducens]
MFRALNAILTESLERQASELGITVDELKARQLKADQDLSDRLSLERDLRHEQELKARQAYGRGLGLGVSAHIGHLILPSHMTERSNCAGLNRRTVLHVVLDEDLKLGRLCRRGGDLLCIKQGNQSFGATGTDTHLGLDFTSWHNQEVTCPKCLAILARRNTLIKDT